MPGRPRPTVGASPRHGSPETWQVPEADLPGGVAVGGVALCVECRLYRPADTVVDVDGRPLCPACRGDEPPPGTDDAADAARAEAAAAAKRKRAR